MKHPINPHSGFEIETPWFLKEQPMCNICTYHIETDLLCELDDTENLIFNL